MCGFLVEAGNILNSDHTLHTIRHRGPDYSAHKIIHLNHNSHILFSHTLLSITGNITSCKQPFTKYSRYTIVYNGELYNHSELKAALSNRGHTFESDGDTEVFLTAYIEWGVAFFQFANGIFSAIIFDNTDNTFIACRDRMGVKPLFYTSQPDHLAFFSEIKQAAPSKKHGEQINTEPCHHFFRTGDLQEETTTLFHDIHQVRAGHYLHATLEAGGRIQCRMTRWHDDSDDSQSSSAVDLYTRLLTAVDEQTSTNESIAICISGGLDSAILAVLYNDVLQKKNATLFGIGYPNSRLDETTFQKSLAAHTKLPYENISLNYDEIFNKIDNVISSNDAPVGGFGAIAQWLMYSKINQTGIRIAIEGQGADELFCGYSHQIRQINEHYTQLKNVISKDSIWHNPGVPILAASGTVPAMPDLKTLCKAPLPALLRLCDRNGMAHGIEVRVPYLATGVIDAALRMPGFRKICGAIGKMPLRTTFSHLLPLSIRARRDKVGFLAPDLEIIDGKREQRMLQYIQKREDACRYFCGIPPDRIEQLPMRKIHLLRAYSLLRWSERIAGLTL